METLAVDGSTLPGLKDLFPEHFFEHPEQAVHIQQPTTLMPQLPDAVPQLTHPQHPQNMAFQQQEMQYAMISGAAGSESAHQLPSTRTKGNSGKRSNKRTYDAVHAQSTSHPRLQNPYHYPSGQQQFPTPSDVHLPLPVSSVQTREDTAEAEDDEDADGTPDGEKRRHPCPRCGKRFNRPSSLKIHLNTHTGAKPYVCPFQGCGRTFNVSSNMRRHFRNHARRPPPPPLPQNNIYPFLPSQSSDHEELHGEWRHTQRDSDSQQQVLSLSLNANYDNATVPGDLPDYSTQFYPPSSDVRSSTTGREQEHSDNSALITPPYTNEGDERDLDNEFQRNFFPPMAPYNTFGPGPGQSSPPSLLDSHRMGVQQMMTRMHSSMGVPLGIGGGAPSVFPVDPSLIGRHDDDDLNADGDADADGEVDPELEGADARREAVTADEGIRRFGPSTSNARASSNPRMELSPRRRDQVIMEGNGLSVPFPVAPSSSDASFSLSANNLSGPLYRQILSPIPTDVTHVSSQASQFPQQYQSYYSQRSQEHQQQQTLTFHSTSGVNTVYGEPRYPAQMQLPNVSYTDSYQYPPYSGQPQQYAQAASLNGHNAYAVANGMRDNGTHQHAFIDGRTHSQNIDGPVRDSEYHGNSARTNLASLKTPGAPPAPPYELYSHLPLESPDSNWKTKSTCRPSPDQVDSKDANAGGDEYKSDETEGDDNDDDDDDDEYTGRLSPKKGKVPKRGTGNRGRGRSHSRPKSSAIASNRGRGRPRKCAPAVIETEGQKVEEESSNLQDGMHSTDGTEIGGRILRKRRRVSKR